MFCSPVTHALCLYNLGCYRPIYIRLYPQSVVVYEVKHWTHTPVIVGSNPSEAVDAFLNLLTTVRKYLYVMQKGGASESTIISRSF